MSEESLEDRLARIERMLAELTDRLARIESMIRQDPGYASLAISLAQALGLSAIEAVQAALRVRDALRRIRRVDPITRAIIEALSHGEWMTLSGLTRAVRSLRGRASRTVIRERIRRLEKLGVVEVRREPSRTLVRLRSME